MPLIQTAAAFRLFPGDSTQNNLVSAWYVPKNSLSQFCCSFIIALVATRGCACKTVVAGLVGVGSDV